MQAIWKFGSYKYWPHWYDTKYLFSLANYVFFFFLILFIPKWNNSYRRILIAHLDRNCHHAASDKEQQAAQAKKMLTSPRRKLWKPFITALWQSTWLWRVPIEISTWGGVRGENWVWIMFYFNACNEQSSGGQWTNLKSSKCIIQKLEITSLPSSVIPKNRKFKLGMDECKWDVKRSQFISVILSNNRMRFLFFFPLSQWQVKHQDKGIETRILHCGQKSLSLLNDWYFYHFL